MAFQYFYDVLNIFSQFSIVSVILVITVCVLLQHIFFSKRYNPPLPPSPKFKLPLIGHLHLLKHDKRKPFEKYRKQFGDVYSLYFGGKLVIVLSGYETLKETFLKNGETFAGRPNLYITDKATRKLGLMLATGDQWREHRRFALSTLKDFGMSKSKLEGKIHEEAVSFLDKLEDLKGKDPATWKDPKVFRPERFLDDNGNVRKRDENVSFFLGKRSCIGESLARAELFIFLSGLVQKFRLESPKNEIVSVEHLDGIFGLVHITKPYKIVATLR